MNDLTKEDEFDPDTRPFSEYFKMAKQIQENQLMRGQKMYSPALPSYKVDNEQNE